MADPSDYAAFASDQARARLEMAVELLRREWRDGCHAGMAYQTATGSVRRLRSVAASEQIAADLSRVIDDLDAYPALPVEDRPAALTAIAEAINWLIIELAIPSGAVESVPMSGSQPTPVTVPESQPNQNVLTPTLHSPASVISALYQLSPSDFEKVVASLLQAQGFTGVQVIGGADDRGVDIISRDSEGRLVAVQCKRFAPASKVNALIVQTLFGMAVNRKAHRAMLVTTGSFTGPARTQAEDYDIELIDGARLASMVSVHPGLVAALDVGEVQSGSVRAAEQPRPLVQGLPYRWPGSRETLKDAPLFYRLAYRFPALTPENMVGVLEWGKKTLCPPTGEGCHHVNLLTLIQCWNNCSLRGRCPMGSIHILPQPSNRPTDPKSWQSLAWDIWIDGRTGKGRLTQKGRPDITQSA
jgi:hypothetical protein